MKSEGYSVIHCIEDITELSYNNVKDAVFGARTCVYIPRAMLIQDPRTRGGIDTCIDFG